MLPLETDEESLLYFEVGRGSVGQWFLTFSLGDPSLKLLVISATPVAICTTCNLYIVYYLL